MLHLHCLGSKKMEEFPSTIHLQRDHPSIHPSYLDLRVFRAPTYRSSLTIVYLERWLDPTHFRILAWLKNQREKTWTKKSRFKVHLLFLMGVILGLLENRSEVVYGGVAFSRNVRHPLKLTWHLKMDGWETTFILGRPIFRGYVFFREREREIVNHEFLCCQPLAIAFKPLLRWS